MAERVVYLSDWQVRAWLAGRLSVLFVPVSRKPPDADDMKTWLMVHCQFARGDVLLGKETWGTWFSDYIYRATPPHSELIDFTHRSFYHSPATMPREAVRIYMPVIGASAVRMRDTTDTTAVMAGIEHHERCEEDVEFAGAVSGCTGNIRRSWFEREWHKRYGSRYPWDTAWAWRIEVRQWK